MPENALLSKLNDGVFIMYHRKSDDYPLIVKPHKWTSLQNSGEIADGVAIVEGGKILVVAPTQATTKLTWSSGEVSGGGTTTWDRVTALNDWNGKTNTQKQIAASKEDAVTNTASYAPGFCNLYSRSNANGKGLTAGKWWLPSLGEMMMIYANMTKVNYALSLISGATQLVEDAYWTSTETSATYAWGLYIFDGVANGGGTKASDQRCVRAVSAFIS
jgi:phage baseplate assembly protein gpV